MTPKYSPILWWPLKISKKSSYPKYHFSENHKNNEIQNFGRKKNDPSLRVYENIKEPPGDGSVFEVIYPWLMESWTGNVF